MADKQEESADIIAEMRFHGQQNIYAEKDKPEYGILTVEGRIIQSYADRLEAAYKREKAAIEADALAVGGIVGASRATAENPSAVGDCAELREALSKFCAYFAVVLNIGMFNRVHLEALLNMAKAALAAPPRNCDIYATAEEAYQARLDDAENWDEFGSPKLKLHEWLFAPATEKEGDSDGNE